MLQNLRYVISGWTDCEPKVQIIRARQTGILIFSIEGITFFWRAPGFYLNRYLLKYMICFFKEEN